MKVKCIYNTGMDLRPYENKSMQVEQLGRFGASGLSKYGEVSLGKEYLVMGIIVFETYQAYLIDDGLISACPCQLFEIMDKKISANWDARTIEKDENIYPYIQMIIGYQELCSDKASYEKLIVEKEEEAQRIYFRRKIEVEKELLEKFD